MSARSTALGLAGIVTLLAGVVGSSARQAVAAPPTSKAPARQQQQAVDLYGDPLPPGAVARLGTGRLRNGTSLSFSPDGKTLYTGSEYTIRSWDVATGIELSALPWLKEYIETIAASPDGKTLAAGGHQGIRLWDMTNGEPIRELKAGSVARLAFSPDGKTLVSGGADHQPALRVWDVATGKELRRMMWHKREVRHLVVAADNRTLISGSFEGPVQVSDLTTGEQISVVAMAKASHTDLDAVFLTPDGKSLGLGGSRWPFRAQNSIPFLEVYDIATGERKQALEVGERRITGAALTPDGTRLVTTRFQTRNSSSLDVWDFPSGKIIRSWEAAGSVRQISPDGKTVAVLVSEAVELWDLATAKRLYEHESHVGEVQSLSFSSDGKTLATTDFNKPEAWLWDVATSKPVRKLRGHEGEYVYVRDAQFLPNGSGIVTGASDSTLRLWDAATGKEVRKFALPGRQQVLRMAISGDGKKLMCASMGFDGGPGFSAAELHVFDIATAIPLITIPSGGPRFSDYPAFAPDGKTVAQAMGEKLSVLDLASGKEIITMTAPDRLSSPSAYSPDGKMVAVNSSTPKQEGLRHYHADYKVRVFDITTGKERHAFAMTHYYHPLAFSRDSRRLAAAGKSIAIWDLETGKELWRSPELHTPVSSLTFSPDGKTLASGMKDSSIVIWDVTRGLGK